MRKRTRNRPFVAWNLLCRTAAGGRASHGGYSAQSPRVLGQRLGWGLVTPVLSGLSITPALGQYGLSTVSIRRGRLDVKGAVRVCVRDADGGPWVFRPNSSG